MEPTQASPTTCGASSALGCSAVVCKAVLKTVLQNAVEYAEAKCLPGPTTIADWKRLIAKFDKHAACIEQTKVADCASCKAKNWCPFSCLYDGRKPCPFYEKSADQPNPALTVPPLAADTVGRVVLPPDSGNHSERK